MTSPENKGKSFSHQRICQRPPWGHWKEPSCSTAGRVRKERFGQQILLLCKCVLFPQAAVFSKLMKSVLFLDVFSARRLLTSFPERVCKQPNLKDLEIALRTDGGILWEREQAIAFWTILTPTLAPRASPFIGPSSFILPSAIGGNREKVVLHHWLCKTKKWGGGEEHKKEGQGPPSQRSMF